MHRRSGKGGIIPALQDPGPFRLLDGRSAGIGHNRALDDPGIVAANVLDNVALLVDFEGVAPPARGANNDGGRRSLFPELDVPAPLLKFEEMSSRGGVELREERL